MPWSTKEQEIEEASFNPPFFLHLLRHQISAKVFAVTGE